MPKRKRGKTPRAASSKKCKDQDAGITTGGSMPKRKRGKTSIAESSKKIKDRAYCKDAGITTRRCWGTSNERMKRYHDEEWANTEYHFDKNHFERLFESMTLQIFQCGLTWKCVFNKRDGFREAFQHFHIERVAKFDEKTIECLTSDTSIIRNRAKIKATIENAKLILTMGKQAFSRLLWTHAPDNLNERHRVDISPSGNHMRTDFKDKNYANRTRSDGAHPTKSCVELSKALKRKGFKFMGPTVTLSFMQAIGLMNHHTKDCFVFERNEHAFYSSRASKGTQATYIQ